VRPADEGSSPLTLRQKWAIIFNMDLTQEQIDFVKSRYNKYFELEQRQRELYLEARKFLNLTEYSEADKNLWEHFFIDDHVRKDDLIFLNDIEDPHPCANGCVCHS
jgi:hypothetical protein